MQEICSLVNRSLHIDIRVSPDEHAAITQRAHLAGVPTSQYLRHRALQDDSRPVVSVDTTCLKDIYRTLRSVSNNVNQIARAINTTHNISALENELKAALESTEYATNSVASFLEQARNKF